MQASKIFVGSIVSVWRAKRLEIKLYLCSNQPNSDKWKLPRDNIVFSIKIFGIHSQTAVHLMLLHSLSGAREKGQDIIVNGLKLRAVLTVYSTLGGLWL